MYLITISQLFCTTEQEYDHTPNEHQSDMPEGALCGSVHLSQLWSKKELKVHFMNPEVLKKDRWEYGGASLSPAHILLMVKSWNENAVSYPNICLSPATKQDADIRVTLDSCECSTDTLISGTVLEYFAGEKPL